MDKIVAIEESPNGMYLFTDKGMEEVDWKPWILKRYNVSDPRGIVKQNKLQGDNELKYKVFYRDRETYNRESRASYARKEIAYADTRQSFLADNPDFKLFQNMKFEEVTRFVIDIETSGLDPAKSRILCIGCNWGENKTVLYHDREDEMIRELNRLIEQVDPDLIEGWNCYDFDFYFLSKRALQNSVHLEWGRNGTDLKEVSKRNFRVGGFVRSIRQWRCFGRHLVDGMLEAMRYDVNTGGKMESYGLKDVAVTLGVREPDRVIVAHADINEEWKNNKDRVIEYCLGDVDETYKIDSIVLPPNFYLTSIIPDTYQGVLVSGGATKINQILVAEYIQANHSIPINTNEEAEYQGGFVELRECGVFSNVYKADVSSLYPSIMLNFDVTPRQDTLGAFKETLQSITDKRLAYKTKQNEIRQQINILKTKREELIKRA